MASERDARELIFALHKQDAIPGLSKLPGLWERKLDQQWTMWINGHKQPLMGGPTGDIPVQPYDCYLEFNGWPAGTFSLVHGDGVIAAGEAANYETFCDALKTALSSGRAGHATPVGLGKGSV